jgi:DNA polymerase alpha subunit A
MLPQFVSLFTNLLVPVTTLHKADPDIIVGHDFLGVSLDVLLHRVRDRKADHWFRIGRFRHSSHSLFTSAFMIASKVMCDDTYSNNGEEDV